MNLHHVKTATNSKQFPIGVFDSGMGGLTVLNALVNKLPQESFIYLGDTARLPYGTKSESTVIRYALQMAQLLIKHRIKLLITACNTASSVALTFLKKQFPHIPIIGVLEPGARAAVATTKNKRIAVLATETTIHAGSYQQSIHQLDASITVTTQSCSLFVALAEEGWIDNEVTLATVKHYLFPIIQQKPQNDCVVLGCTHFPVLINPLKTILGDKINIVDSAEETAKEVLSTLAQLNLINNNTQHATVNFFVTDLPERFIRVGEIFFKQPINPDCVHLVESVPSVNA